MPNFEIVPSDPDVKEIAMSFSREGDTTFIRQTDTGNHTANIMLNVEEAKQVIAVLSSFIAGRLDHTSDCALYSSPAYPIEPCTCDT